MTADDFFLLSIAFSGFLILALALWSLARVADQKQDRKRGPDIRPDVDSPGASRGDERQEAARSRRANDFLHRLAEWTDSAWRRAQHLRGAADTKV